MKTKTTSLQTAFFLIVCFVSFLPQAFATQQMMETLIYKGETMGLDSTPLTSYFDETHPSPDFPMMDCTGEMKGYHGVWEIKDGALYLVKVQQACPQAGDPDVYGAVIFKDQELPVKAVWVSGTLPASLGMKTVYLNFDKGVLISEETVDRPLSSYGDPFGAPPPEWDVPSPTDTE